MLCIIVPKQFQTLTSLSSLISLTNISNIRIIYSLLISSLLSIVLHCWFDFDKSISTNNNSSNNTYNNSNNNTTNNTNNNTIEKRSVIIKIKFRWILRNIKSTNENKSMKDFIGAFGRHEDISYENTEFTSNSLTANSKSIIFVMPFF